MQIIKPNSGYQAHQELLSIFLAGSIEMGLAEDWQEVIPTRFKDKPVCFFNPRRDDWDSSWIQKQTDPQFNYQVNWEMSRLERSDLIFMYFSPETKSPISLLELGAYGDSDKMIVCCPDGFWRQGNVEIFCARKNIPFFKDFEEAVGALHTKAFSLLSDLVY